VKSGDDLAVLRSPDFGQAQADYRRATADLVQATKTLARATALRKFGAAAEKDLEGAESDFNRAAAENRRAEARLRSLGGFDGEFSDQYHLISPVAGVVVDRSLNVGQEVRADIILAGTPQLAAPHFVVTDPTRLWVALDVPESDLNRLQQGQSIEVRSTAFPGRSFTGTIENIGAFLDPQTRVARVRASVDNSAGLLKAEMYVMVRVTDVQRTASTVDIPSRAVVFSNGRTYVFVETNPLRFERREVSVESEDRGDGNRMSVSGVAAGERVVSEGSLLINELLVEPGESATVGEADSPRG
jgi:cobalt-zinc-cadmium efflux system membrane fusion protein